MVDRDTQTTPPSRTFIVTEGMGAGPARPGSYNYKVSPITNDEGEETGKLFELFHDPTLSGVEGRLAFAIQMSLDEADELAEFLHSEGGESGGVGPSFFEDDDDAPENEDAEDEQLSPEDLEAKMQAREDRHGVPLSPGDALRKQGANMTRKSEEHGQRRVARPSGERTAAKSAKANKGHEPAGKPRDKVDAPEAETNEPADTKGKTKAEAKAEKAEKGASVAPPKE